MDIIERAARAIFSCNFALHEQQEVIDQKWFEWPEDRRKAERQARAVLAAFASAQKPLGAEFEALWDANVEQLYEE